MALRERTPEVLTLWEAVNFIARGDWQESITPDRQKPELERAKIELLLALRDGELYATGRENGVEVYPGMESPSLEELFPGVKGMQPEAWSHSMRGTVNWEESQTFSFSAIVLRYSDVRKIWGHKHASRSAAGAPPKYDEKQFLRFCVLEASISNGLPKNQSEFRRRMEEVMQRILSDRNMPKETWFSEAIAAIYAVEKDYKRAKRTLE